MKDPESPLKEGYFFSSSLPGFPGLPPFSVGPGPSPPLWLLADFSGCSLGNGAGSALDSASPEPLASDTKAFGAPNRIPLPQVWDSSWSPPLGREKEGARLESLGGGWKTRASLEREVDPNSRVRGGAVQPRSPSWKPEAARARRAGAGRGCGSDSPCTPPPTWPPPSQPLRGSGTASCGSGRGYRRPRLGQLSSAAPPRHLAQGVMAPLRVERAAGGSQLEVTRARRPAPLRLPLLLLLLLLPGGERSARGRGGRRGKFGRGRGPGSPRPARDHRASTNRRAELL